MDLRLTALYAAVCTGWIRAADEPVCGFNEVPRSLNGTTEMTCWEVIAKADSQGSTSLSGWTRHPQEPGEETTTSPRRWGNGTSDCVCAPSYARTKFGECVAEADCLKCKPEFREDFSTCSTDCQLVCNYTVPDKCYFLCVRGCFCIPGHVRSTPTGPCVPVKQCPPRCSHPNMVFSSCASADPPVCNVTSLIAHRVSRCLNSGCRCRPGYVLHPIQYNTCIPWSLCSETSWH